MEDEPTQQSGSTSQRHRRRALLGGVAVLAACAAPPKAAPAEPAVRAALPAPPPPAPAAAPVVAAPEPVPAPVPAPQPSLSDLGPERIVQPFWSGDGTRVLYYDQPAAGQGGTWAVEPGGQPAQERAQWGYYVSGGTLLVTPRPDRRDTYVLHLPSGREWTLATTNGALFSADGTVVAYNAAAAQPGRGGGSRNFQPTTLALGGADGQGMRRVALPMNASPVAWVPGRDGGENGRLLLTGRRNRSDGTAFYLLDVRDGSLNDFGRSRRLLGPLVSPSGQWMAYVAMWNGDPAQNGLWVSRADGAQPRRLDFMAGYRWTGDDRLILIPARRSAADGHEVWELTPDTWALRRLTDPALTPFRIANFDWDLSPDGTGIVFVSADTRRLTHLSLPNGLDAAAGAAPPAGPPAPDAPSNTPYRLPFQAAPGPSAWYIAQWYGVTTGGYRARNSAYREGQGIHFGIDFATPFGTPVVALAPGRVIAVDGNYGSPPHNVVIQLPDGNQAMYGHLMEPSRHVQVGQTVEAGQVVGNTGDSSAPYDGYGNPHIHLELRKRGRDVATNLVPNFDVNWDDLSLGVYPGPRFERNLDDPRRYQFPDDQPDIRFGGAIITNFGRPWPP